MTERRTAGHRLDVFSEDLVIGFRVQKVLTDVKDEKTARIGFIFLRKMNLPRIEKKAFIGGGKISLMVDMECQGS